jgi:hypothetical protein
MAESWRITGEYIADCNCRVSPCPCTTAGGDPTEGECRSGTVFSITQGKYGNVDLAGLGIAMIAKWPGNVLAGNWSVGLVIDEKANDKQAEALQTILSGKAGGTFADFGPLIKNFLGVQRSKISYQKSGEEATARVDGSELRYTPLKSPAGKRTEVHHGALAFREKIYPGKAAGGRINFFGINAEMNYGEWSDFEFAGP